MKHFGSRLKKKFEKKGKDDKISPEDYEHLRIENEELKEHLEEVEGNLELAKATERFNAGHLAELPKLQAELQSCREELESRIQSEQESSSSQDEAMLASQTKHSELEAQMAASEERHKAMQLRLAAEVTSKDSVANDAKAKLSQVEKALAALREESAESANEVIEMRQKISELHAKLSSTEEEEQVLRNAALHHDEAVNELRSAVSKAKEDAVSSSNEAESADTSLVAVLRAEIAEQESNAKQELENLRSELLSGSAADGTTDLSFSTYEVVQPDHRDECQAEHLESQIRDLQSEVSKSEALVAALQSQLQLAEVRASASQQLDGQDDSSLRTCVPADVGGSAEREVSAHYDEVRRLLEELQHTKDENFELINGQAEHAMGLQEARDTNATLEARLLILEAQVAESSQAATSHVVAHDGDDSAILETHTEATLASTSAEESHHSDEKLREKLEVLESEVADLTRKASEQSEAADERLVESEARQQEADDALERSEAQRTSQQLALVDAQCECDAMRQELAEKSELVTEQATGRANVLVLELAEKDVTCASLEERCQSLDQGKEEAAKASEELEAKLREELQEAAEATSSTEATLNEELVHKNEELSAASNIGKEEASENVQLQQEVAKHEARIEHSEVLLQELRNELEQAKASPVHVQPDLDENSPILHDLRMELLEEKRRYASAEFKQAVDPNEVERLHEELLDETNAVQIFLQMDEDGGKEQIRIMQNECSKLKDDLRRANARANFLEADNAVKHEETLASRMHRPTAEFGKSRSCVGARDADVSATQSTSGGIPRERQLTFAKFPDLDGSDTMLSDKAAFEEPSQDFKPPPRTKSGVQKAVSWVDEPAKNPWDDEVRNDEQPNNPWNDEVRVDERAENPWDDEVLGTATLSDSHDSSKLGMSPQRLSVDTVPREEYLLEVQACCRAREEAAQCANKQNGIESDVAHELQLAKRALADEEAKSRRLCEHALRAEQSRRSLYHEILEDYKSTDKDADLMKLAQLVGRAAKAIAAVSAVAPRLAPAVFSPAQEPHAETSSAAISRTPASPRPVHQEALSGIQGAPGRPDGRPPRSPRLPGSGDTQNRTVSPSRIPALPYCQTQPNGPPSTPSFDKAAPHFQEMIKQADAMDTVTPGDIQDINDELSLI